MRARQPRSLVRSRPADIGNSGIVDSSRRRDFLAGASGADGALPIPNLRAWDYLNHTATTNVARLARAAGMRHGDFAAT